MIISLSKYKRHGYIKGIFLIIKKMFISLNYTSLPKSNLLKTKKFSYSNYPSLKTDEERTNCTSCKLCEKICPTGAIGIETSFQTQNFKEGPKPNAFWLNLSTCNQCNLCIDLCPVEALDGSGEYEFGTNIKNPINIL